ncbi:UNVERIFIED_CONTAM: hypothetical protein HDU68_007360 [Siphonaria sp. JEL0065]|nr:hypothetical protein HDU68_007360 [Siphonaria sp. JEL0065]
MDSAAELVVAAINNSSDILPETVVNILRIQSWDNYFPGSGSATTGALHVAMNHPGLVLHSSEVYPIVAYIFADVIAAFGDTSEFNNEGFILKNTWRLFRNVRRVALVYDIDDIESAGAYKDIKTELQKKGVIILVSRYYHGRGSHIDFTDILDDLKLVDARYIILCAQSWTPSYDLVNEASKTGLVSPNHLWIVTNQPYPADYPGIGNDPRLDKLIGMVWPSLDGEKPTTVDFVNSQNNWIEFYNRDPLKYQIDYLNWVNEGAYDCLGTLLYGLDKFIRDSGFSADMLANRGLNLYLNFTVFKDAGFRGTLLNPMRLDGNGDITA